MIKKNTQKYIDQKKVDGLYGIDFLQAEHPGETLKEELNFFGMSQKDLAVKIDYTPQTVNRIIKGTEPITTEFAIALERAFSGHPNAQFWLNMQNDYDQELVKEKELINTESEIIFFKKDVKETFKELQKGGIFTDYILNKKENYQKAIVDIKDFFGSSNILGIPSESFLGTVWRKGEKKDANKYNLAAILKIGEKKAKKILKNNIIPEYNKDDFLKVLKELKKLSRKESKVFLAKLQEETLKCGVIVVYVPNMTKTLFGGATFWLADRPVILLKVEKQWEDTFWFNFYHEAGHIILHRKREVFVDFDENGEKNELEQEADNFASEMLIPGFDKIRGLSRTTIKKIAAEYGVSASILAGRVAKTVNTSEIWKELSEFRPTIKEKVSFT